MMTETMKYKELFTALAKAQAEMPTAGKNTSGYNYKYADLAEIIKISRPALTKNGLSIMQVLIPGTEDSPAVLNTMLCHASGEFIESKIKLIVPNDNKNQNKLQSLGTALTYLRRYSYSAIIGIVTDQDSDGNTGVGNSVNTYQNSRYSTKT